MCIGTSGILTFCSNKTGYLDFTRNVSSSKKTSGAKVKRIEVRRKEPMLMRNIGRFDI